MINSPPLSVLKMVRNMQQNMQGSLITDNFNRWEIPRLLKQNFHYLLLFIFAIAILVNWDCNAVHRLLYLPKRDIDFRFFYLGAQALLNKNNLYAVGQGGYIYPPFFAALVTPLTYFSYHTATLIWLTINHILIFTILWLGYRVTAAAFSLKNNVWKILGAFALAFILTYDPIHWEIQLEQVDTITLFCFALALYLLDRQPLVAGIALGILINIKYQAIFFIPLLLLRGRYRVVVGLLMGVILAAFLPVLIIGWQQNLIYLEIAFRGIFSMSNQSILPYDFAAKVPKIFWERNVTITCGLYRIFMSHGWSITAFVSTVAAIALAAFLLIWQMFRNHGIAFIWRPGIKTDVMMLEWYTFLVFLLLFAPQGTTRHLFLILNINLLTAILLLYPHNNIKRWPLILGLMIFEYGLHSNFPFTTAAWRYWGGTYWLLLPYIFAINWSVLNRLDSSLAADKLPKFARSFRMPYSQST
jgi:hypothetical protein